MGVNWTEEQQKVISLRDRNILTALITGGWIMGTSAI